MTSIIGGDLYAGLSGIELEKDSFELGDGIRLARTYAHQFAPFMLAFGRPSPGKHHPGPWKAVGGGFAFDITAELFIPAEVGRKHGSQEDISCLLVSMLRLGVNPAVMLPTFSGCSFGSLPTIEENKVKLRPFEVEPRHFPLSVADGTLTSEAANWIKDHWPIAKKMKASHAEFELAFAALDRAQFVRESALALVSVWAALEALFSPSTTELSFRVSALISAYLEQPGASRLAKQKAVAKLYTKRSAAAHGKPSHDQQNLLDSMNLLREVVLKMLDDGRVPSKAELEASLFGASME